MTCGVGIEGQVAEDACNAGEAGAVELDAFLAILGVRLRGAWVVEAGRILGADGAFGGWGIDVKGGVTCGVEFVGLVVEEAPDVGLVSVTIGLIGEGRVVGVEGGDGAEGVDNNGTEYVNCEGDDGCSTDGSGVARRARTFPRDLCAVNLLVP